jgi:hypothetical protein
MERDMADSPNSMMKNLPINPHHEVSETFCDTLGSIFFDGQSLRLEFTVGRLDEQKPPATTPTGMRHVVARIALTLPAAIDLINQMQMLAGQLKLSGLIGTDQGKAGPPQNSN